MFLVVVLGSTVLARLATLFVLREGGQKDGCQTWIGRFAEWYEARTGTSQVDDRLARGQFAGL